MAQDLIVAPGVDVVARVHPILYTRRITLCLPAGATIAQMIEIAAPAPGLRPHIAVTVGGEIVAPKDWGRVRPRPGHLVVINVTPGKGGGKNPFRMLLSIAVMAAAAFLAPMIASALAPELAWGASIEGALGTFGTYSMQFGALKLAIGAGISMLGNMAINAIAPPPRPQLSALSGTGTATMARVSPTLAITGAGNRANPYGVVPRVLGRHRMYPPLGARYHTELQGDDQYLRCLFDFGYGPLELSDIRIGTTAIGLFDGVEWEIRPGWPDDAPLTLYTDAVREDQYNVRISNYGGPVVLETRDATAEILIDLAFRGLLKFEGLSRLERSVEFDVKYRRAGSSAEWTTAGIYKVTAKTEETVRYGVRIVPPEVGRYEVRFFRRTADNGGWTAAQMDQNAYWNKYPDVASSADFGRGTLNGAWRHWVEFGQGENREFTPLAGATPGPGDVTIRDDSYVTAIRSVQHMTPVDAPGHCLMALRIKATEQLNGVVDQLSAVAQALLPVWDGTQWAVQATRHPAWAYLEILRGPANPDPVTDSRIDLDAFRAWALEDPGRTFDAVIDFSTTVRAALVDIASASRAAFGMRDGKFSITRDARQTGPVQHFTPRNCWGFKGIRSFTEAAHALRVRFVSPGLDWGQDERVVYADGYSEASASRFEILELFGCTDPAQAWRDGRYHLAVGALRRDVYELSCDIDHLVCTAGDLVRVSHDVPRWGGGAARIKTVVLTEDGEATGVTLDDVVVMEAGKSYGLRIRRADNSEAYASIVTQSGETTSLTFAVPLPAASTPGVGDLVMFGWAGRETVDLLVKAIRYIGDLRATLTLLDAAPAVHDAEEGPIPAYDPQASTDPLVVPPPAASGLSLSEVVRFPSGMAVSDVVARWQPSGLAAVYEVYTWDGARWRLLDVTTATRATVASGLERGQSVEVAVLGVSRSGRKLDIQDASRAAITTAGDTVAPADIRALTVEETADGTRRFRAVFEAAVDHAGLIYRFHAGTNFHWESAQPLHDGVVRAQPFETRRLSGGTYTVLAKAVDTTGNQSAGAAAVVVALGDRLPANIIQRVDVGAAGWPGEIIGGVIVGGAIEAGSAGEPAWADWATPAWTGDNDPAWDGDSFPAWADTTAPAWTGDGDPAWTELHFGLTYTTTVDVDGPGTFSLDVAGDGAITPLYRNRWGRPAWTGDGNPAWTGDDLPAWEDDAYCPYDGPVVASPGPYDIRLEIPSGLVQGRVSRLVATIDLEDQEERFEDVVVPLAGMRLIPSRRFRSIAAVAVTIQDDGGDAVRVRILDRDPGAGPMIQLVDAQGQPTTGLIDAIIHGVRQ